MHSLPVVTAVLHPRFFCYNNDEYRSGKYEVAVWQPMKLEWVSGLDLDGVKGGTRSSSPWLNLGSIWVLTASIVHIDPGMGYHMGLISAEVFGEG